MIGLCSRHTPLCRSLGPSEMQRRGRGAALCACGREVGSAVRRRGHGTPRKKNPFRQEWRKGGMGKSIEGKRNAGQRGAGYSTAPRTNQPGGSCISALLHFEGQKRQRACRPIPATYWVRFGWVVKLPGPKHWPPIIPGVSFQPRCSGQSRRDTHHARMLTQRRSLAILFKCILFLRI